MTRTERFETEVRQRLNNLKKDIDNFDRTNLDENQMQELARAEKVLKYLLTQINLIDTDLLPQSFYKEVAEIQNWESQDIAILNNILDSSLIILNKYRNFDTVKGTAFQNISDMLNAYHTSLDKSIKALNLNKVKKDSDSIQSYEKLLNSENGTKAKIKEMQDEIQTWFNEIQKFRNNCFVKQDNSSLSLEREIQDAKITATSIVNDMEQKEKEFSQTKSKLDEFYYKIFGNNEVKGLEQEIDDRQNQLNDYDKEQKMKFKSLNDEIESLLKDATNASLASSYEKSKISYKWAIVGWNTAFFFAIFAIIGVAIWGFIETISQFEKDKALDGLLPDSLSLIVTAILVRLPFYIPLAWLAIFSTQRRNESKRLQEEYKHKETLARSFLGYKKQIDEIQSDSSQDDMNLAKKLMENLVEMTNENPNKSLDKIKKENMPTIEFGEKTLNFLKDSFGKK